MGFKLFLVTKQIYINPLRFLNFIYIYKLNQNKKMVKKEIAKDFSVVILSAGSSSRMKTHKALLNYDEERNFLQKIVKDYYDFECKEIFVVVNSELLNLLQAMKLNLPDNVVFIENKHPEWHRFYSLKIGVKALKESNSIFVHNIDNPFVSEELLALLKKENAQVVIPEYNGKGGHPILLSKDIIVDLKGTEENQKHLKDYLNSFLSKRVPVSDDRIHININTQEEYQKYFKK